MTPWQRFVFTCIFQKQKEANELLTKSDHTCGKKNGTWNMANKEFLGKSLPIPQKRMSGFKLAKDIDCPVSAGNATWELLGKSADSRETRGGLINIKISTFDAKEAQGKSYMYRQCFSMKSFHFSLIVTIWISPRFLLQIVVCGVEWLGEVWTVEKRWGLQESQR